ncbi:CRISPR-associated helicase Cas3' [Oceanidesulfovibrio marinus]|nr:CRISPR-associated helicase Cas3' [Oceanidesulfovibrio marinus]
MESVRFWGKAQHNSNNSHLVEFHCLDVAAVLTELLEMDGVLRQRVEGLACCPYAVIKPILQFFAAIHDIGKFSAGFQWLRGDIAAAWGHPPYLRAGTPPHHTKAGWWFYRNRIMSRTTDLPQCAAWRAHFRMLAPLAMAAIGHHGAPVDDTEVNQRDFSYSNEAALHHAGEMAELFLPAEPPELFDDEDRFRPLSWLFAGLMVAADWIGSSEEYFPYRSDPMDAGAYYALAQQRARTAVRMCGLLHPAAAQGQDFSSLLPQLKGYSPRPLQRYAMEDAVVDASPQLHIFEDLTGCGKTEAALLCVHTIMEQGGCSGFYVGLPTMATANAMYHRLAATYRALFDEKDGVPSLMLAHGQQNIEDAFLQTIALEDDAAPRMGERSDVTCSQWLADNRKKALLAPCGAGTLDQALLAVLPAKHQSLRLAGLSRTVLIADEVHSYDLYTGELLATLLTFIAAMGSSAVLLTATLPQSLRLKLVHAFQRGLGRAESAQLDKDDFPLATRVNAAGEVFEQPIPAEGHGKTTAVALVHDESAMFATLVQVHRDGACACWVRNTVDQAMDTAERLVTDYGLPPNKVILCHARFAMCDRLAREKDILRRFGKGSTSEDRAGYILVGSQVLEQSLDYDVGLMLSDLAPMDALIQRAGRCHRHTRERPEGYGTPRLVILSPEPVDDPAADWYGALLGTARFVYRKQALLWRTARLLKEHGRIVLPGDARVLMEGAYGEAIEAPAVLEEADLRPLGDELAARSLAYQNVLALDSGYSLDAGAGWSDDTAAATRIGDERVQLRLCCVGEDGRITLWVGGAGAKACALSEVSVSTKRVDRPGSEPASVALEAFAETMPDKGRWVRLVALRQSGGDEWTGQVPKDGTLVAVRYSRAKGLRIE